MLVDIFSFYFILGIIISYHFAQHSIIHLTIYGSLEEHMPSSVYKITACCFDCFHKISREMLGYSFILSAYLWLNLLISSLTYGTLRS